MPSLEIRPDIFEKHQSLFGDKTDPGMPAYIGVPRLTNPCTTGSSHGGLSLNFGNSHAGRLSDRNISQYPCWF